MYKHKTNTNILNGKSEFNSVKSTLTNAGKLKINEQKNFNFNVTGISKELVTCLQ